MYRKIDLLYLFVVWYGHPKLSMHKCRDMIARMCLTTLLILCVSSVSVYAAPAKRVAGDTLLALLRQHQYEKLEQLLSTALHDYEGNSLHSDGLARGFSSFSRPDEVLREAFDEWVERMPRSAYARLPSWNL